MLPMVYSYSYTTVQDSIQLSALEAQSQSGLPLIAGLGYGVPLARLYASYFGGDLKIMPFHGVGTDVIIYLDRLSRQLERQWAPE